MLHLMPLIIIPICIAALCLSLSTIVIASIAETKRSFADNTISSLEENIFGNCKWEIVHDLGAEFPNQTDFLIIPQYPSKREIAVFGSTPHTLTKANKDLAIGMVMVSFWCTSSSFYNQSTASNRCLKKVVITAIQTNN